MITTSKGMYVTQTHTRGGSISPISMADIDKISVFLIQHIGDININII